MRFTIGSDILGSVTDLSYDPTKEKLECCAGDGWIYTDMPTDRPLIKELLALNKLTVSRQLPQRFVQAMISSGVDTAQPLPWKYIIPGKIYKQYCMQVARDVSRHFQALNKDYYIDTFMATRDVLDALAPAVIDKQIYLKHARTEENQAVLSVLESFEPGKDGLPQPLKYDRFSSRTGRLVVASGPNILILKKQYRDMLKSRYPNGRIIQFDYSSFEARLALSIAQKNSGIKDIYAYISNELFDGRVGRDICKTMTLGVLFGMGVETMAGLTGVTPKLASAASRRIKDYFKFHDTVKSLYESVTKTNALNSLYGRRVMADSLSRGKIFNLFIQSTGVDAALLGFRKLLKQSAANDIVMTPLFVLHDALIVDCPQATVALLDDITAFGASIPKLQGAFPIKHSVLSI